MGIHIVKSNQSSSRLLSSSYCKCPRIVMIARFRANIAMLASPLHKALSGDFLIGSSTENVVLDS